MKINRHGKGALLTDCDYKRIRSKMKSPHHRLIFDIARYTGERWGAIRLLEVSDVFDGRGNPREQITYRAATRKADPSGHRTTRQVPVHPLLAEQLRAFTLPPSGWLFPSRICPGEPISLKAADLMLRSAIAAAGLSSKGICTHSTRITFISNLHALGISTKIIQELTGHKDVRVLNGYIVTSEEQLFNAIALL